MPCYHPLKAYSAPGGGISFNHSKSFGIPVELPCGRCIGCRLESAKSWAIRCTHESQMHTSNVFITLTYKNAELPPGDQLLHLDFQKFIRALRKKTGKKIRYYMSGEYGEPTEKNKFIARPHYHAILFGYEFPDAYYHCTRKGNRVYRSPLLESLWQKGNSEIGSVTFQSAGYVARYILKKQNGDATELFNRYVIVDESTGEMTSRKLEYTQMSMHPGIGKSWFDKYQADVFPHDYIVMDGRKMPTPRYYRDLLAKTNPKLSDQLKAARIEKARQDPNSTPERLLVRETCQTRKAEKLKREL